MMHTKKKILGNNNDRFIIDKTAKIDDGVAVSEIFKKGEGSTIINEDCFSRCELRSIQRSRNRSRSNNTTWLISRWRCTPTLYIQVTW